MTDAEIIAEADAKKIHRDYDPKPMPDRCCDWAAVEDNYDEGSPIGYGATEVEAIKDLFSQLEELG